MLQKCSIYKTAEVFFITPSKRYSLIDISRSICLAHTSVKKNLDNLIKQGIINEHIEKKGKRKYPSYEANRSSHNYISNKILYNLRSLMDSNVIDLIQDSLMPRSIILFGSFLRGEDTEDSDIDLYVEAKKEDLYLKQYEKKLNRKIELHFNDNFASYPKELKNNIANGFVLKGFLEGFK